MVVGFEADVCGVCGQVGDWCGCPVPVVGFGVDVYRHRWSGEGRLIVEWLEGRVGAGGVLRRYRRGRLVGRVVGGLSQPISVRVRMFDMVDAWVEPWDEYRFGSLA